MKTAAKRILNKYEAGDLLGAGLELRKIQRTKQFESWGYESLRTFIEDFGYRGYRKWMFLIEVVSGAERLGYTAAESRKLLQELDQTRTRIIFGLLDKKCSVDGLIKRYRHSSVSQIQADLSGKPMENFTARITKKNAERLYKALTKHGMQPARGHKRHIGRAFDRYLAKQLGQH